MNEENFILEYYGMKETETDEKTKIATDFGDLVNLLSMFSEKINQQNQQYEKDNNGKK